MEVMIMKTNRPVRLIPIWTLLFLTYCNHTALPQTSLKPLFSRVDKSTVRLSDAETSALQKVLTQDLITSDFDIVRFNGLEDDSSIVVDFGKEGCPELRLSRRSSDILGNTTLVFDVDKRTHAILVMNAGSVIFFAQRGDHVVNVEPISERYFVLTHFDQAKANISVILDDTPRAYQRHVPMPFKTEPPRPMSLDRVDSDYTIDVLVAYTPMAADEWHHITMHIGQAIAQANDTYQNSGINVSLALVCAVEVDYTESGQMETDLNRFAEPYDGYMDEIHDLRSQCLCAHLR
jgi:hypothetical protein